MALPPAIDGGSDVGGSSDLTCTDSGSGSITTTPGNARIAALRHPPARSNHMATYRTETGSEVETEEDGDFTVTFSMTLPDDDEDEDG